MAIHIPLDIGEFESPFDFLRAVMNNPRATMEQRLSAAKILAQFMPGRKHEIVYKSRDAALLDSAQNSIFANATMSAPKK